MQYHFLPVLQLKKDTQIYQTKTFTWISVNPLIKKYTSNQSIKRTFENTLKFKATPIIRKKQHVHTYSKSSGDMYPPCSSIFSGVADGGHLQKMNKCFLHILTNLWCLDVERKRDTGPNVVINMMHMILIIIHVNLYKSIKKREITYLSKIV